jgi:hypothetical protein
MRVAAYVLITRCHLLILQMHIHGMMRIVVMGKWRDSIHCRSMARLGSRVGRAEGILSRRLLAHLYGPAARCKPKVMIEEMRPASAPVGKLATDRR